MNKQQFIVSGAIGILIYLISTGISFAGFSYIGGRGSTDVNDTGSDSQSHFVIDPSLPKTESCPINGQMYTKQEKDLWEKNRPLAVMIENHAESRPQTGLSRADVIYEAVAEGGITRFMGIFYCGIAAYDTNFAPVRSARTYYLPWVLEYDALYVHVGGAGRCSDPTVDERAKALCQIGTYKIKDMDQFGISFPTCYRNYDRLDHPVATEHTMVCSSQKLYNVASERGWTNVDAKGTSWDKNFESWEFKDDADIKDRTASYSASFTFWSGYEDQYGVSWQYDNKSNSYKRSNGGKAHIDLDTGKQITAKAVVVQFAREIGPVDEHKHLLYENIGNGTGLIFQDGKVEKITWRKTDRSARTKFIDKKGQEIEFNRGQIWIELLPTGAEVNY